MSGAVKQEGIESGSGSAAIEVPSGLKLDFQSKPRRRYTVNGEEVPSVTEILKCLFVPLGWWGMETGVRGCLDLIPLGDLALTPNPSATGFVAAIKTKEGWQYASVENVVNKLTERKLTVNHVRDEAAERGQTVHDALERWAITGEVPNPKDFSFEQEGYVTALVKFIEDADVEPVAVERMVGSAEHKYAGRFDLECKVNVERDVVFKALTQKGEPLKGSPKHGRLPLGLGVLDLKTSKDVYYSHFIQGEGYEGARIECGYEPSAFRGVIHVSKHGLYQLRVNYDKVTFDDFLNARRMYDSVGVAEKAVKA